MACSNTTSMTFSSTTMTRDKSTPHISAYESTKSSEANQTVVQPGSSF